MHQRPSRCWTCETSSAANFGSPEPAAEKNGKDGAISRSPRTVVMSGRTQQGLRLFLREPIADANPCRLYTLHAADPLGQFRCEQSVVRRLASELADRRHSNNDGRRAQSALFERYAPRRLRSPW